jgi:hypothetical protein
MVRFLNSSVSFSVETSFVITSGKKADTRECDVISAVTECMVTPVRKRTPKRHASAVTSSVQ